MTPHKIEARHGVFWMVHAIRLLASRPAPFLAMGAMLTVLGAVPLLGAIAVFVLGPAFNGGIMLAAREQQCGRSARFDMLWAALRQPGKLPSMLVLCLPALLCSLLAIAFLLVFHADAIAALAAVAEAGEAIDPQDLASFASAMPVFLALALLAYALVFFAVPRVMLDDAQPLPAMMESLQLCLRNWAAMVLLMLTTATLVLTLIVLTGWLPLLLQLLLGVVVTPLVAMANLNAFRDVFDEPKAADEDDTAGPSSPTLEA
jgi:hypothetical protein